MKNKLGAASLKMATLNGVLTLSRLSRLSWILLVVFSSAACVKVVVASIVKLLSYIPVPVSARARD